MKEWCMAHPWMTFFIIIAFLITMENVFVVINNKIKLRAIEIENKK
jgi:hypothetical protein